MTHGRGRRWETIELEFQRFQALLGCDDLGLQPWSSASTNRSPTASSMVVMSLRSSSRTPAQVEEGLAIVCPVT